MVENMSSACGKLEISPELFKRLAKLGRALDQEQQLSVFDGGLVGFDHETESEVIHHVSQGKAHRSATGSRKGQRESSRPWWRSSGSGHHFRSEAHERAFGTEFRILAQHYDALAFEDQHGLWATLSSSPLGRAGPQVDFLIGVLGDRRVLPRAWAFQRIGPRTKLMPLKHTNFPDASVCAFITEDQAWSPDKGFVAFADHLTVWAVKKFHHMSVGWWPGPQFGHGALYRRLEFSPEEWCGCRSGKRYRDCHFATDMLVDEASAKAEFLSAFGSEYESRLYPAEIVTAAKSRWRKMPSLQAAFSFRPIKVDFTL